MEHHTPFLLDMIKCVDVTIVGIQIKIRRELYDLLLASSPLVERGIQLINLVGMLKRING
jgi:hypothetical protein